MGSACLDEQGTVLWQQQELTYNSRHGNGGSQVLVDDKLIFICDGMEESFVAAIHKDTGKIVWKTDQTNANQVASFSTPCLVEDNGQKQLVCPGSGFVRAYNPDDGRQIWYLNYGRGYSVISRPVYGLGMVFVASGWSDQTLYAIRPNGTGDVTNTHVAWKTDEDVPRTSSILLADDMLFYVSDTGTATCVDAATGTVHWQEKIGGKYSASPVYADGRIYCTAEDGKVIVLKAGTTFEKLAENDLDELTIASPAIVDKALFFRTESHLYRIEEK
jgi:outer membrane protein assembly factor BamB